ncbi:LmeA family phospholipid-binding protein [Kineosporia succinea]|uniref:DUF2993 family protein n=1 Tax=Kineosporia succinea TaxID=84632 RepID=A0ABT9PC29_9ACTN|nr:LmeA family phospholipid-binding protein [Kineosporia succinea]MDP9830262.1 hypothetical protein [Kineosporia succinea]
MATTSRRLRWILILIVMLALLAGVNVALDRYLEVRARDEAACRLPEGASVVDVEVGGNALLSLLHGRFDSIVVHSRGFALGPDTGVTADVIVRMRDVLIDRHASFEERIGSVDLEIGLPAATLRQLMAAGPEAPATVPDLTITDGVLRASVTAAGVPVTVSLTPTVAAGDVRLTPTAVRIGNRTFAPELLRNVRGYPSLTTTAGDLLSPRDIDVPHLMPRVDPDSATVVGDQLRLRLGVDDAGVTSYLAENAERAATRSACS